MRIKNLILGIAAIVFAAGSAFTGKNKSIINNVRIWWKQTPTSSFVCTALPLECQNTPDGTLCTIVIVKADGSSEVVNALNFPVCAVQLHTTTHHTGAYDAGVGARPYEVANTSSGL